MGQDQGEAGAQLAGDPDDRAAQLRAEIEGTRQDLGDTAAELAAKTDVKARAQAKFEQVKRTTASKREELLAKRKQSSGDASGSAVEQLQTKVRQYPVPATAAALLGGFVLGRLTRGRGD